MDPIATPESLISADCTESDIAQDGSVTIRRIAGRKIAFARRSRQDQAIVAFESQCPHMQAPLRFGRVEEGEVICPWHFFRFDTATGAAVGCEKSRMSLKTYSVQVIDGRIYLDAMAPQGAPVNPA